MTIPLKLVDLMFQYGCVCIDTDKGFALAAGGRSPVYLDHRRLFAVPGLRELALDLWTESLQGYLSRVVLKGDRFVAADWVIAGTATAGIAPAFGLAARLGCPFAYVRSGNKAHGLGRAVEGAEVGSSRVVVVDDMVTTGSSLLTAAHQLKREGAAVACATSFTTRVARHELAWVACGAEVGASAHEPSAAERLDFYAVASLRELLGVARQLAVIRPEQWSEVDRWLESQTLGHT